MLRLRPFLIALLLIALLCLLGRHSVRTQSPLRRITNTAEDGISLNPSIAGDGRVVSFESTEDLAGAGGVESFRAIRANVSVEPTTFSQLGATRAPAPAISQDGSRIAFASTDNPLGTNNDTNSEIFLFDGARLAQITNTSPRESASRLIDGNFSPSISDDGRFIAFSSNRDPSNQNSDANLEIFIFDTVAQTFTQLTNTLGIVGSTDAKISGNGANIAYIRDPGTVLSAKRDLVVQNRVGPPDVRVLASAVQTLTLTYGRAISDDGERVVWSAETAPNITQVFFFDGRNNNMTRQITTLGSRAADVPLHPTISGDGFRIAFATRRSVSGMGSNSDNSVELYTFHVPSGTFGRVTNVNSSAATADVVTSLNDDGSLIAFNYPRVLSGLVANDNFANNSEIYLSTTPAIPSSGALTILNRASMGHEPSSTKAVAPGSIAAAFSSLLSFQTQQAHPLANGALPSTVGGTTVTVNGRRAEIFFVSPAEVHFQLPLQTDVGNAEVVVTNSDGFQSRATVPTLNAAPGVFTKSGDGLGEGMILNAETLVAGPFDPSSGDLRLSIFATGAVNAATLSVIAGGRLLTLESITSLPTMPGMEEIHVRVPAHLRGAGKVDLVVRAEGRDSNPVLIEFSGDTRRDILINEFLADPPDGPAGDANHDGTRDTSQDEFVELVNTTTHDIDVSGYQILTRGTNSTSDTLRHSFPTRTIVPACTAIAVFGGGTFDPHNEAFARAQVVKASSGSLALNNSAGLITLQAPDSAIASSVAYGGSTGLNADDNQSLTRVPDITGSFVKHGSATGGTRLFSPGAQLDATLFGPCNPKVARIEISPPVANINLGQQQQFTARGFDAINNGLPGIIFSWQSSNSAVATIDQNGLLTGLTPGATEIRAIGRGVVSDPALVVVSQPPPVLTGMTLTPANATIGVGETQQLTAQAKDQFGRDLGGVTITFASDHSTVALIDSIISDTNAGSATATVSGLANGVAGIRASATKGPTTITSPPTRMVVEPAAGQLLISEFRTRGAAGPNDEFIEIYNPTNSPLSIGGLKIRASNSIGTTSDRITLAADTTLGPGCHYLVANSSTLGYSGSVSADQMYLIGIADEGGVAMTSSNGARIIDAVGMSGSSAYREGVPLVALSNNLNQSYERLPGGALGNGADTNNNTFDFFLNKSNSNPQNRLTSCLDLNVADLTITVLDSPDPVGIGSEISYSIQVTNNGAGLAQSIVVTDVLAANMDFVSCVSTGAGVCSGSGNNRTITFPSLASGANASITLVAKVKGPAGSISNTASVSAITIDSDQGNNSATVVTVVQPQPPTLTIDDVTAIEGPSGATAFTFTVSSSSPASTNVRFNISTHASTALAGNDYVDVSLANQTLLAGQQHYTFTVIVNGDLLVEPEETFFVTITNVVGALVTDGQGLGTILNDDIPDLVISQFYGGGGNSGALFTNDFVEILNRGETTVNFGLTPFSIQYAGATANFGANKLDLTSGIVLPGQYFLVRLSGGVNGTSLPTPDASGSLVMAATAGKIALVASPTSLPSVTCPRTGGAVREDDLAVVDLVGYGAAANCFEGTGPAPAPSSTMAEVRHAGGCVNTHNNATDFFAYRPAPRNTTSPMNNCVPGSLPSLSIDDVAIDEGNAGSKVFAFTVALSSPSLSTDVVFDIATHNGTATTGNNDYLARSLTRQIIPAGQQTYSFEVIVNGDTEVEPNETFEVNVSNASGAAVVDDHGVGTIENDDLPTLSVNDVALTEGDSGSKLFTFVVSLSAPADSPVRFDIATQNGTATTGNNDYLARSLTRQIIPAGQQTYSFEVTVNGDTAVEPNETFEVNVSNASGAAVVDDHGVGTIENDDLPTLSVNDVALAEGDSGSKLLTFVVSLSAPADSPVRFDIATQDNTALVADNDYISKALSAQTIPAGQIDYSFAVTVNGDLNVEPDESFFVRFTNVVGATVFDNQGLATIQNDDVANLLISQVYAGGGNSGADFANDFVEIFNRGTTTVNFASTPYSLQYAGSTSNFGSAKLDLTSGTISPGQYFLVQLSGGGDGPPLPEPSASGSISMAATAGKIALVGGTTSLTGSGCPLATAVEDFVGYGTTPNCFTGTGPAPAPNTSTANFRRAGGCTETRNNSSDFFGHAPAPRNSGSPANDCNPHKPPDLTIDDVAMAEGGSGSKIFSFLIKLSAPAPGSDVTFDIATQDNSATTTNNDYAGRTLTGQIIPAGQQSYRFDVTVNGDAALESDELFNVNITNVSGATLTDAQGVGTILNDDLPLLLINDVAQAEGNSGTKVFNFTVSLSRPALSSVSFDIATQDESATRANLDYLGDIYTGLSIPAGQQTCDVAVLVNGDLTIEGNESFLVNLSNVSGAIISDGQGRGTILNDDSAALSINDIVIKEGDSDATTVTFTVSSSLPSPAGGITFDIATQDNTATAGSGDYVSKSLINQEMLAGQSTYTFDVKVNGDLDPEAAETFFVKLINVRGGTVMDGQGLATIENDDAADLVISQLYGGGGNSGAHFTNDFVELFNRGTTPVDFAVTPYSLQYAGATANFGSNKLDLTAGTILPGQYFLVRLSGGANGAPLPTPDASGSIVLAATAGKVALVLDNRSLTGNGCPLADSVVDFVGYGLTANCFAGVGPAAATSGNTAAIRQAGGCANTDNNAADFFVHGAAPRNTSSPINSCVASKQPDLSITNVVLSEGNSGAKIFSFTVSLSAPSPSADITFDIATQNNTATTSNSDYVARSLTNQIVPAGQQTYSFDVTVNGDKEVESNEMFFVNVTNVRNATPKDGQAVGTILNDDLPTISINDVSMTEGNTGIKVFTFIVSLSTPALSDPVSFDIATEDNTATAANNDYVARSLAQQLVPPGQQDYSFAVTVTGDRDIETDETFFVKLANVNGAIPGDTRGVGTIQNDDTPALSINDAAVIEGNNGAVTASFTVTSSLAAPAAGITFDISTQDSSATADADYFSRTLMSQSIPAGQTTFAFTVTINGDTIVEADETFLVKVTPIASAIVSDDTGVGTIQNDDTPQLVISQLYGGGGNSGSPLNHDFIEIFNRGSTTVDLNGWSIQYNSASGTDSWSVTALCPGDACLLVPGQYFLVQEAGTGASNLPHANVLGTIAIATTSGKVALVNNMTALSGACPSTNVHIVDRLGYGGTANSADFCFEGAGPAPAPSSSNSNFRKSGGCMDTNENAADFVIAGPNPRNLASPLNDCNAAPVLTSVTISPLSATIAVGSPQQFTGQAVDQFGQPISGVTIGFVSNNVLLATIDSTTPTSISGSATTTVLGQASGTAEITAQAYNGVDTVTSIPATLSIEPAAGQVLISEFRTRGPAGASDEFIEIYNPTNSPVVIGGLKLRASTSTGTPSDRVTIAAGMTLGPGCHYLVANNTAATGYSGPTSPDQTYTTAIADNGGIAVTRSDNSLIDEVGMNSTSAYQEGSVLAPMTGSGNQSYERKPGGPQGNGTDTNNNGSDFMLNSGNSNPQNSSSGCINLNAADLSLSKSVDHPSPIVGSSVSFTISLANAGPAAASGVTIKDLLPPGLTFVSATSDRGAYDHHTGLWTVGNVNVGANAGTLVIKATVSTLGNKTNTAEIVASDTVDADSSPNNQNAGEDDQSSVTLTPSALLEADLSIAETDSPDPVAMGNDISYTINVNNAGPDAAGNAVLSSSVPINTTFRSMAIPVGWICPTLPGPGGTGAINCTSSNFAVGWSVFTLVVRVGAVVAQNTVISDTSSVSSSTADSNNDNNSATTTTGVNKPSLVITHIYPGGGLTNASFTNDFIEIFNSGTTTVDFAATPYSVQFLSTNGATWARTDLNTNTIAPGQYFLVQGVSGGGVGAPLPAPDAVGSINLTSTTPGKVALVFGTTLLTGNCPGDDGASPFNPGVAAIVDLVGYGGTATTGNHCYEGSGPAAFSTNTDQNRRAVIRTLSCVDTSSNPADFSSPPNPTGAKPPVPRNKATPIASCP